MASPAHHPVELHIREPSRILSQMTSGEATNTGDEDALLQETIPPWKKGLIGALLEDESPFFTRGYLSLSLYIVLEKGDLTPSLRRIWISSG